MWIVFFEGRKFNAEDRTLCVGEILPFVTGTYHFYTESMTYIASENRIISAAPAGNVSYQARRMPLLIGPGFAYVKAGHGRFIRSERQQCGPFAGKEGFSFLPGSMYRTGGCLGNGSQLYKQHKSRAKGRMVTLPNRYLIPDFFLERSKITTWLEDARI